MVSRFFERVVAYPAPRETNPQNSPHIGCLPRPTGRISNFGLRFLFGCLTDRIANLFFRVMMSIFTISAAQNHRARKACMAKFAMRCLAPGTGIVPRRCKVCNQLADFERLDFQYRRNGKPSTLLANLQFQNA